MESKAQPVNHEENLAAHITSLGMIAGLFQHGANLIALNTTAAKHTAGELLELGEQHCLLLQADLNRALHDNKASIEPIATTGSDQVVKLCDEVSDKFDDCCLLASTLEELIVKNADTELTGNLAKNLREKLRSHMILYMKKMDEFNEAFTATREAK